MKLIKMKTAELVCAALDWAVGVSMGQTMRQHGGLDIPAWFDGDNKLIYLPASAFSPSTKWEHGGLVFAELMATGQFGVSPHYSGVGFDICNQNCESVPFDNDWSKECIYIEGKDLLALICIAYVTHKIGEEVEVPAELMQVGAA